MSLKQTLENAKSRLSALVTYANGVTSKNDTNIGDAIKSLADGYNHDIPFEFTGTNAQLVATYEKDFTLADTSFVIGENASTSSTSIRSATSNMFTSPSLTIGDKDLVVVQYGYVEPTHDSSATNKVLQKKYVICHITFLSKRKTTDTSAKTTRQSIVSSTYMTSYYNSSSVVTRAVANYGFYMTPATATVSSSTANACTIHANSPTLYYRASSTYESTTNIKLVTDVVYKWRVYAYTLEPQSNIASVINDKIDQILINGLD